MKRTAVTISSLSVAGALLLLCLTASLSIVSAAGDGYINVDLNQSPQFDGSVLKAAVPFDVSFNVWRPQHTAGTQYTWDFGDGAASAERSPTHTYSTPGNYTVRLTVTNSSGTFVTEKENYIQAGTLPIALFHADEVKGIEPLKVHFIDESTGNPDSWKWDFGDGQTSDLQSPQHFYTRYGSYNVTLTVQNEFGTSTLMRVNDGRMVYLPSSNSGTANNSTSDKGNDVAASDNVTVIDASNGTQVIDGADTGNQTQRQSSGSAPEAQVPDAAVPGFSFAAAVLGMICLASVLYRRK